MVVTRGLFRYSVLMFAVAYVLVRPAAAIPPSDSLRTVIVTIDGIRKTEFLQWNTRLEAWIDTAGAYVPNLINRTRGVTDPNHAILWGSGDPEQCLNHEGHPADPMHFELLRKERGLPASATVFVTGKNHVIETDQCSDHREYGAPYRATTLLTTSIPPPCLNDIMPYQGPDSLIVQKAISFLDTNEVVWAGINLSEYDFMAHLMGFMCADWDTAAYWEKLEEIYLEAEHQIIDVLWPFLENHPRYGGRTVLVIATDHGRHDDDEGVGFHSHGHGYLNPSGGCGLNCAGCRNIWAMYVGPGIRRGCRANATYEIDDVAPTVRLLLGFSNPYEIGSPIDEILDSETATGVAASPGRPVRLVVSGAGPNPFHRSTAVRFSSSLGGAVELLVFDCRGRLVHRDAKAWSGPGPDTFIWDGRTGSGRDSPAGVYFATVVAAGARGTVKVIHLR